MLKFSQLANPSYKINVILKQLKASEKLLTTRKLRVSNVQSSSYCSSIKNRKIKKLKRNNKIMEQGSSAQFKEFEQQKLKLLKYRKWEHTGLGNILNRGQETIDGLPFILMSYNILAQDLVNHHPNLYSEHDERAMPWNYRLKRLICEILEMSPHILCLQEMQEEHLEEFHKSLNRLNFKFIYKKRTGSDKTDGCAIFYNENMFNLELEHKVEYFQPNVETLDRENVAIIAKFSLKSNPRARFVVSTTHLLYNPRRQDVRLAQIQVLLAELDRISYEGKFTDGSNKFVPIILTGDFNLKPFTAPYKLITNGDLNLENLNHRSLEKQQGIKSPLKVLPSRLGITDHCQHVDKDKSRLFHSKSKVNPDKNGIKTELYGTGSLKHNLNLFSVYRHYYNSTNYVEASTFHDEWINVDYLFYSKHFSPKVNSICEGYLKLLSKYVLPSIEQCYAMGKIPNLYFGSDHLALAARFFLKPPSN